MEQQIIQLTAVVEAMETLTLVGSKSCGTYYNCMKMLAQTVQELKQIQAEQNKLTEDTEQNKNDEPVVIEK